MTCPRIMGFVGTWSVWCCVKPGCRQPSVDEEDRCTIPLLPLALWRLPVIRAPRQSEAVFGLPSNNFEEKRLILVQFRAKQKLNS